MREQFLQHAASAPKKALVITHSNAPKLVLGLCRSSLTVFKKEASFCHFKFTVILLAKIQAAFVLFKEECESLCMCIPVRKIKNDSTFALLETDTS